MKLSTKGRYAVTAMIDLGLHQNERLVNLSEISATQDISLSYLEQLFSQLRRQQLVEGFRGPGGGYRLALPPEAISIADIVTAVNEKIDITLCAGRENCRGGSKCLSHELWMGLSQQMFNFLQSITLADVINSPAIRKNSAQEKTLLNLSKQKVEVNNNIRV